MGASYYVAIHEAKWPSFATLNASLAKLNYPIRTAPGSGFEMGKPLKDDDGLLRVVYRDEEVELEASVTKLSAEESFAYEVPAGDHALGIAKLNSLVPVDTNLELRKLGMAAPDFQYGDFVLTLTLRSSVSEWKAGFVLMAGLIRCSKALGSSSKATLMADQVSLTS
jgi:hypothetical protein